MKPSKKTTSGAGQEPDFRQLRYFGGRESMGFGITIWSEYFRAPLYAQMYARFGVLPDDFGVLVSLHDCGVLSAKTICTMTGRPKNSIGRSVGRLVAAGHIKSVVNPEDRREQFLSLLPEGRKLYKQLLPLCRERERALLGILSTAELLMLDEVFMKLLLHYHTSPEGMGLEKLKELGIPDTLRKNA